MKKDYLQEISALTAKSPKQVCVAFAIFCARDCLCLIKDKGIRSIFTSILDMSERYNRCLATQTEMDIAHSASRRTVYPATVASAANAVNAACSAAYNAVHATDAAYYAAYAARAAYVVYIARSVVSDVSRDDKLKEYHEVLKSMLKNLTLLEKIIYNIDNQEVI